MGDNSCLIHGFSYASAIPNDSKQGNPMHALGESISFGRFMTESLSWDRWSTFSSHKKYVEEAERYAQPGSVARKKAFFEAHYKRMAAQRAAALLEQEDASKNAAVGVSDRDDCSERTDIMNTHSDVDIKISDVKIQDAKDDDFVDSDEHLENGSAGSTITSANEDLMENPVKVNPMKELDDIESHEGDYGSETSGVILMERPLLKNRGDIPSVTSKKKPGLSSLKTSISKQRKVPPTPAKQVTPRVNNENNTTTISRKPIMELMEKRRSAVKSLWSVMNVGNVKEPDKEPISTTATTTKKTGGSTFPYIHSKEPKFYAASPFRTPIAAASKCVVTSPAATPRSANRRMKTPKINPLGSKSAGPKWHILSSVCSKSFTACRNRLQNPTLSTPFVLRTEERAARRKQKLENKFDASDMQVQKTLKEMAGNEFRKLGCCFKATPLPDFYKETLIQKNQVKKNTATQCQSATLGRTTQGTVSVPPTPPKYTAKNDASKNLLRKKLHNPSQLRRNPLLDKSNETVFSSTGSKMISVELIVA